MNAEIRIALASVGGQWVSAKRIAEQLNVPWQAVARRLVKMSVFHEVETQQIERRSAKSRMRRSHLYRAWPAMSVAYPSWLVPQGSEENIKGARLVVGRASLRTGNRKVPI